MKIKIIIILGYSISTLFIPLILTKGYCDSGNNVQVTNSPYLRNNINKNIIAKGINGQPPDYTMYVLFETTPSGIISNIGSVEQNIIDIKVYYYDVVYHTAVDTHIFHIYPNKTLKPGESLEWQGEFYSIVLHHSSLDVRVDIISIVETKAVKQAELHFGTASAVKKKIKELKDKKELLKE